MGIGWQQLLIVAVIVLLLFGTKKLRGAGGDLGAAIKGFKKAIKEDESEKKDADFDNKPIEQKKTQESADVQKDKEQA